MLNVNRILLNLYNVKIVYLYIVYKSNLVVTYTVSAYWVRVHGMKKISEGARKSSRVAGRARPTLHGRVTINS